MTGRKIGVEPEVSRGRLVLLGGTSLVCGAAIMVVEVLGSRVIGPFFGVSLFVWTSLITVTMISLALGYAMGGLVADRMRNLDTLYRIILLAGLAVVAIPLMKSPILKLCRPLGLRLGAFTSSLLLFGPSLFLLGCVSPYVIKAAAREVSKIGTTVGLFYAISTTGSIIGTIATGFILISYLRVSTIFTVTGLVLVALGLGYALFHRRFWGVAALLAALLPPPSAEPGLSRLMPSGTRVTLVESIDSHYGSLKVVEYSYGPRRTRELIIDGFVQGGIDVRDGLSVYAYNYLMQLLPRAVKPDGKRCLVLGLGAGLIPQWYEARGVETVAVEIDPDIVGLARDYFGFQGEKNVRIEDARTFLAHGETHYDYVILDVFNGDVTPAHLLTVEAFRSVRSRLSRDGVLAINYAGPFTERNQMTASVLRTLGEVFRTVEVYPTFDPAKESSGNMAILAYDSDPVALGPDLFMAQPIHPMARPAAVGSVTWKGPLPKSKDAFILTDDYSPVDLRDSWYRELLRDRILKTTHWDILLARSRWVRPRNEQWPLKKRGEAS